KHISKAAGTGLIPEKVEACLKLLEVDSPELFTCKSALFDGCKFALALKNMEKEIRRSSTFGFRDQLCLAKSGVRVSVRVKFQVRFWLRFVVKIDFGSCGNKVLWSAIGTVSCSCSLGIGFVFVSLNVSVVCKLVFALESVFVSVSIYRFEIVRCENKWSFKLRLRDWL
nr:hypothetical protein CTI12_AA610890 [Tanacetum cinerariifolium]